MLTYRVGAAGSPSAGRAMAEHLREQTQPTDQADLARYYQQGMTANLAGELGTDSLAREVEALLMAGVPFDGLPGALATAIEARHDAMVANQRQDSREAETIQLLAEWVAVAPGGSGRRGEAETALTQVHDTRITELRHKLMGMDTPGPPNTNVSVSEWQAEITTREADKERIARAFAAAMDHAVERHRQVLAEADALRGGKTAAEPRRDMHPGLAELLGLQPHRSPNRDEIASLLNGKRADGQAIAGKQVQQGSVSLVEALGVDPARLPTPAEIGHILDGRRTDGKVVESRPELATARARFLAALGVKGEPDDAARNNLLAGRKGDGSAIDLNTYGARVEASHAQVGFIDLTFSADKSLSVAWAFAPTEAERNILAQAHKDAVASAMAYVAAELGHVSKGKGRGQGSEAGDIGWLAFDHYTSRPTVEVARTDAQGRAYTELVSSRIVAGDPQLHTHVAVPNVVLSASGRVGAIDFDKIDGKVKEFGAYYQAHVATNLRRHGVEVELDARTGAARLMAIPERVRDDFSKRTVNGATAAREFAAREGLDWDTLSPERKVGLMKEGTQRMKMAKASGLSELDRQLFENSARKDDLGDFVAWRRQAEALGYTHHSVLRPNAVTAAAAMPVPTRDTRLEQAYQAALPLLDAELQRRAKVDGQDIRVVATRGLVASGVEHWDDIGAITRAFATRGVRQDGRETALIWGEDVAVRGKARVGVTTALHESQENELIALARAAAGDRSAALRPAAIARTVRAREALPLEAGGLRFGTGQGRAQRAMMDQLGVGGRLAVGIGVAGAGKSALLAPLVDAWKQDGRQVFGAALAWRQANDLGAAGIEVKHTAAFAAFIRRVETGRYKPNHNSVVVVDELGLMGTRQLLDMMRLREKHGFTLVAVGDPRQCQAIEAGPVISILREALGEAAVPELLTTVRQATASERETSLLFRDGRAAEAIEAKLANGTAHSVPGGRDEVVRRVATLWRERTEANAADPTFTLTVSTPSNAEARVIAQAIREQRREMGLLGPDQVTVKAQDAAGAQYDVHLGVGDRVRLFAVTRASFGGGKAGNIGENGSVLEVRGIDASGVTLINKHGSTGHVKWDTLRAKDGGRIRIAHGDVLTIDSVQGATSTEHIDAMPAGSKAVNSFKSYVAESRHRRTSWLVVSDGAERQEIAARRPLGDVRPITTRAVWENVARNLSRVPEKSGSLAFLERASSVRRGTVGALQRGLQPAEQRRHEGKVPTTLHQAIERKRRTAIVERVTEVRAGVTARRKQAFAAAAALRPTVREVAARNMRRLQPAIERIAKMAQTLRDIRMTRSIETARSETTQSQRKARRPRMR